MAGIDDILAGGAGSSSRADFSGLFTGPIDAYNAARDQKFKNDQRDAFKNGVPLGADGQPDWGAATKTFLQKGAFDQAAASAKIGIEQQKLKYGLDSAQQDFPTPASAGSQPPIVGPSTSRNPIVGDPTKRADAGTTQPQHQPTVMTVLAAQGIPNDQLGAASASVARQLGVDPTAPLDINDPQVRNVLAPAVAQLKRMGLGQVQPPQPGDNPPQPAPPAPQPALSTPAISTPDPTFGGLVPAGRTPQQQIDLLSRKVASGLLAPEVAKVYETRIKAIQDALQPTTEMKNAAAAGMSPREFMDKNDTATTDRAVLTTSILPKLDTSQGTATAARDEIQSIHRARSQLDAPGGIFSGTAADTRLKLAKVAEFLGVPDAGKIVNSEAFGSAIGSRVLALVKNLGSGTAISNADRDFAAAMAGGNLKLDEKSIRRILDIGEKAARVRIQQHNDLVDHTLKSNDSLSGYGPVYKVDSPGDYQKPQPAPAVGTVFGGFKYLGGDPSNQKSWGKP